MKNSEYILSKIYRGHDAPPDNANLIGGSLIKFYGAQRVIGFSVRNICSELIRQQMVNLFTSALTASQE